MNYEGDKAILFCLSESPKSVPCTTKVDSKWTVRGDFDTHHFCPPKINNRFAPPRLSALHLGANGRSRPKRRLSAITGNLLRRFGDYADAAFLW